MPRRTEHTRGSPPEGGVGADAALLMPIVAVAVGGVRVVVVVVVTAGGSGGDREFWNAVGKSTACSSCCASWRRLWTATTVAGVGG